MRIMPRQVAEDEGLGDHLRFILWRPCGHKKLIAQLGSSSIPYLGLSSIGLGQACAPKKPSGRTTNG